MPAVPAQRDWTRGELTSAAEANTNIANPITFYRQRPMWLASYITNFSVASDTNYHLLTFASGDVFVDSENMHAAGDSKIFAVRPGLYDIRAQATFTTNANGVRRLKVDAVSGATGVDTIVQETGAAASNSTDPAPSGGGSANQETSVRLGDLGYYLNAGDYLQFYAGQNSGSSLNLLSGATDRISWFCVRWVAAT